jgi:CubicO group peptidase (beta-lactamase class C family)
VKVEPGGDAESLDPTIFRNTFSIKYALPVAEHLFASVNVPIFINREIDESNLMSKTYRYSDWGFMYMQRVVEKIAGKQLHYLVDDLFYKPLGMNNTSFFPWNKFAIERIPPSEVDTVYRQQTIQGYVNDQNASLMGGISGHAGLFANANDVAKLMQLYANKGGYGGRHYFDADLVDEFTACRFCEKNGNRRGLGFEKPEPKLHKNSPVERIMSLESYGHLGYTGTICWVDPVRSLVFVMLTNRTYPNDGKKFTVMNVRSRILAEFAKVIDELENKSGNE